MGLDVMLWMFSANTEDFDAIHRYHPKWVLTSEAPLLRGWLSYQGAPPLARRSLASLPCDSATCGLGTRHSSPNDPAHRT
jgi:hypothetical protein